MKPNESQFPEQEDEQDYMARKFGHVMFEDSKKENAHEIERKKAEKKLG